jgi:hypothetical protein
VSAVPAPTFVSDSTKDDTTGLDFTVTAPSSITDGNMLVAFEICLGSGPPTTPGAPSGWTALGSQGWDAGNGMIEIFYKIASSEPPSYTFHSGGPGCESIVYVLNISGVSGSAPDAISGGASGNSNQPGGGTINVPAGQHLVLAGYGAVGSRVYTMSGGATDVGAVTGSNETADTSYVARSTAGNYTPGTQLDSAAQWGGLACSVKGLSGSVPRPVVVSSGIHPSFLE